MRATSSIRIPGIFVSSASLTMLLATVIPRTIRIEHSTLSIPLLMIASAFSIFSVENLQSVRSGAMIMPRHRWTVTAQFLDFWLAAAQDAAYNSSGGTIVRNSSGADGKHIGEETDIYSWYELNRHLNIGAGLATSRRAGSSLPQPTHSFTEVPTSPSTSRMPGGRNIVDRATRAVPRQD